MKFLHILICLLILISSCNIKMSNNPPPPPMEWHSFPCSGFQLNDLLDSLVANDSNLFYDVFKRGRAYQYFGLFMQDKKDTIAFIVYISGNYRTWIEQSDSSYLALMDITKDVPSLDSFSTIINRDTLSTNEKKKLSNIFSTKVIEPIRDALVKSGLYSIRPLSVKDTLEARWIICKGKFNSMCDTFWLTSKNGAEWILSDSSIFVPYKY